MNLQLFLTVTCMSVFTGCKEENKYVQTFEMQFCLLQQFRVPCLELLAYKSIGEYLVTGPKDLLQNISTV